MTSHIAFIGLGNMGGPMAQNLLKHDYKVTVFDLNEEAVKLLTDQGAQAATSAVTAAQQADVVVTMLPNGDIVKSLYIGDKGLIQAANNKTLLIDCSTIAAEDARAVNAAAKAAGIGMIDAPVSGGTAAAEAGTLTFICGGDTADYEAAQPVLSAMGKNIFHAGEAGAGQVAKICNNMLLAIHMIGTSEALNMGVAQGLDPAVMSDIMKASSGNNWSLQVYNPYPGVMPNVPASRGYQGGFMVELMNKDLGLAQKLAAQSKAATPLGALSAQLYQIHQNQGGNGLDFSSILQFLQSKQ
ncbi:3-hydroxyisobutyrate dehydrogenase [Marinicella gelatinilytica]|uniref:3-hydroxyisobutyrate dehydrogenase n=1 Tax=Marinicella gelatinilytica TaxID=2996017 RepID=UPI002260F414|nr:3-hydroxyisobutyrate dehydrogenase [Marinicella gelatinilytica]MCX7546063.1 3-hydroxyisobutyrate dehydrogenase [Marinicella gelatinilytica]